MVRRALTRQTRWYQNRCSTFKIKDVIVQKPFWKILEFWPLVTSILTWAKKWPKWFRDDFSRAFERRFPFCTTMRRSRDRRGVFKHPPPPSRWWKIQRPSRARVNLRPGGGHFGPPWVFLPITRKRIGATYVTKLDIAFHWSILHLLWNFCVGVTSGQVMPRRVTWPNLQKGLCSCHSYSS